MGSALLAGCQRPLSSHPSPQSLQAAVDQAIARELQAVPQDEEAAGDQPAVKPIPPPPPSPVLVELEPRREELEALSPPIALGGEGQRPTVQLGRDLAGQEQEVIQLGLNDAVMSAIRHNLPIRTARLLPAIAVEEVIVAEAVFDAVLFSNVDLAWIDQPQRVPVINGIPLGTQFSASESYRFETGVSKRFTTGTNVFVSTDVTRFRNRSPGITFFPDPAYTNAVRFGVGQPLLRGFGSDVNTATIRIARNEAQRSVQQLQIDVLELIANTETAYWNLEIAWRELAIAHWLVDVGVEVREIMERRREFDIGPAQYSDAVARVEQRLADVIRAQRRVRLASDVLKTIINDPQIPVAIEAVLQPIDVPLDAPIAYSLREAILAAVDPIDGRPEIRQAALDIDDAAIRQRVADNDLLPLLTVSAEAAFTGLDNNVGGAYREVGDAEFIDYLVGLAFELPLGNRAAEASARVARLQRSAAMLNYLRAVQLVVLDVKNALRNVVTNLELIYATRSFRVAQAENLRTLLVEEELLAALTPEFLNLKFTRQETLAQARIQEVQALADFNKALAELYRAMGTSLRMRQIDLEVE